MTQYTLRDTTTTTKTLRDHLNDTPNSHNLNNYCDYGTCKATYTTHHKNTTLGQSCAKHAAALYKTAVDKYGVENVTIKPKEKTDRTTPVIRN